MRTDEFWMGGHPKAGPIFSAIKPGQSWREENWISRFVCALSFSFSFHYFLFFSVLLPVSSRNRFYCRCLSLVGASPENITLRYTLLPPSFYSHSQNDRPKCQPINSETLSLCFDSDCMQCAPPSSLRSLYLSLTNIFLSARLAPSSTLYRIGKAFLSAWDAWTRRLKDGSNAV